MDETRTIQLRVPVKADGGSWTEITLRPPTFGEVLDSRAAPDATLKLIEAVTGVKAPILLQLDMRDVEDADAYLNAIMQDGEAEDGETEAQPEARTITFRAPVKRGERAWTEMDLRAPRFGEVKAARKVPDPLRQAASLISQISGVPLDAIREADFRDIRDAGAYLAGFTRRGPATGPS